MLVSNGVIDNFSVDGLAPSKTLRFGNLFIRPEIIFCKESEVKISTIMKCILSGVVLSLFWLSGGSVPVVSPDVVVEGGGQAQPAEVGRHQQA